MNTAKKIFLYLIIFIISFTSCNLPESPNKKSNHNKEISGISSSAIFEGYQVDDQMLFHYKDYDPGSMLYFGHYEQDNNLENGDEKIEWIVLEKKYGRLLIISRYILDFIPYDKVNSLYDSKWEISSLRQWLNNDFYENSFSKNEKAVISNTTQLNQYPTKDTEASVTYDNIFVLNIIEYDYYLHNYLDADAATTPYAMSKTDSISINNSTCNSWWVRGYAENYKETLINRPASADCYNVDDIYSSADPTIGVRPALWIQTELPDNIFSGSQARTVPYGQINSVKRMFLGNYEQDGNLQNGAEPIEWYVIEQKSENTFLLLSRFVLEFLPYNDGLETGEFMDSYEYYKDNNTWDKSSIRKWLNESFFIESFTDAEKELIDLYDMSTNYKSRDIGATILSEKNIVSQDRAILLNYDEFPKETPSYLKEGRLSDFLLTNYNADIMKEDLVDYWGRDTENREEGRMWIAMFTGEVIRGDKDERYFLPIDCHIGVRPAITITLPR